MLAKGIRLTRSGRFQARIYHQGRNYVTRWDSESQALGWLQRTRRELANGTYADQVVTDPDRGKPLAPTFKENAEWVVERDLKPRTRSE